MHAPRIIPLFVLVLVGLAFFPPPAASHSLPWACAGNTGAITRSSATNENAFFSPTTYTIDSGVTVTSSTQKGIVICAETSITINGTLSVVGLGQAGATADNTAGTAGFGLGGLAGTAGAPGAGGGAPAAANLYNIATLQAGLPVTEAALTGAGGARSAAPSTINTAGGSSGGSAHGSPPAGANGGTSTGTAGSNGNGGNGGGYIILLAPTITVGAAGIIDASGTNGGAGSNNGAGGGGGAGGQIILVTNTFTVTAGGIVRANGGNGGNGGGAGATGGSGAQYTLTGTVGATAGSAPTLTGGGGGSGASAGRIQTRPFSVGTSGTDGFTTLVTTTAESPGANCADGGRKLTSGLDNGDGGGTARDGTLQAGEVDHTAYVCDGADGATGATGAAGADGDDGFNSLATSTTESPGANCANGGQRVDTGLDNGDGAGNPNDGILHPDEVDDTGYACNGATGATGATGANGANGYDWIELYTSESPGANCEAGGVKVDAGLDNGDGGGTARDGLLQNGEKDISPYYICNGEIGDTGPQGPPGASDITCDTHNCTLIEQQGWVELPGYTDEQVGAFLLFLVVLIIAFFQRWLFVAIACVIGILDVVLIGGIFGFTFTGLLLVLGIVMQILVDHRDALREARAEKEAEQVG